MKPLHFDDPDDWETIEESLKRRFTPPPLEGLQKKIDLAARKSASNKPSARWLALLCAATIMLGFVLLMESKTGNPPGNPDSVALSTKAGRKMGQGWHDFYSSHLGTDKEFRPMSFCSSPLEAADYSAAGPPGQVEFLPNPNLLFLGEMMTPHADTPRCLLVHVPGEDAYLFVYVLSSKQDPLPVLPGHSPLFLHRKELGHLVLYELSPLNRPNSLDAFTLKTV